MISLRTLVIAMILLAAGFVCFITAQLFYLGNHHGLAKPAKKFHIVCTTGMIGDVVHNIVGDRARVTSLMGPGVDPHTYHACTKDVHALLQADVIFYNGLHLEGKMVDLFESMQSKKTIVAIGDRFAKNRLIPTGFDNVYDPHIWHDVMIWKDVVMIICDVICHIDPTDQADYIHNAQEYMKKLDELHAYVQTALAQIPQSKRILISAHDAFSYFGKAYDVKVVALQGISTDADISTRDISHLAQFIVLHHVPAIFLESSVSPRGIQAVYQAVKAKGWQVRIIEQKLFSDSLGDEPRCNSYITTIKHNVDVIVDGLKG